MKLKSLKLILIAVFVTLPFSIPILKGEASSTPESDAPLSSGMGSVETLEANYKVWAAEYERNGGERNLIVPMSANKGVSTEQAAAYGMATLNLIDQTVSVEVRGFADTDKLDFWLIDNRSGADRTLAPETGDAMARVGALSREGGVAKLDASFGGQVSADFEPDFIAITRAGKSPVEDRLLTGQTTLFQKLYRSDKQGRFGQLSDSDKAAQTSGEERDIRAVGRLAESAGQCAGRADT